MVRVSSRIRSPRNFKGVKGAKTKTVRVQLLAGRGSNNHAPLRPHLVPGTGHKQHTKNANAGVVAKTQHVTISKPVTIRTTSKKAHTA